MHWFSKIITVLVHELQITCLWDILSVAPSRYTESDLIKLDILINGDRVEPLATIVHKDKVRKDLVTCLRLKKESRIHVKEMKLLHKILLVHFSLTIVTRPGAFSHGTSVKTESSIVSYILLLLTWKNFTCMPHEYRLTEYSFCLPLEHLLGTRK